MTSLSCAYWTAFAIVIASKNRWRELLNPLLWKEIWLVTIFIGLFYGLYFVALEHTTPGNAALLGLLQVFTTFVFFQLVRKEGFSKTYILGSIAIVAGALIVLIPHWSGFNLGDAFVLLAILFPPIGNLFQQRARAVASSETVMFLRNVLIAPFAFLLAAFLGNSYTLGNVESSLPFLLINGFLIFGLSKIFFLEAIHRIPVTKVIALESGAPLITFLAAWAILGQVPTGWQLLALIPLIFGVLLLTDQLKLSHPDAGVV